MPQIVLHQHLDNKWVEIVVNWGGKYTNTCPHTVLSIIDVLPLLPFSFLFSTLFWKISHENLKMIKTDQKTKISCIFEWPESAYEGLVNCVYRKYILQMHKYLPQFIIINGHSPSVLSGHIKNVFGYLIWCESIFAF